MAAGPLLRAGMGSAASSLLRGFMGGVATVARNIVSKMLTLLDHGGGFRRTVPVSQSLQWWANDGTWAVFREELPKSVPSSAFSQFSTLLSPVYDGTTINQVAARNETVSVGLILENPNGFAVSDVTVDFDTLTGPGAVKIETTNKSDVSNYVGRPIEVFVADYLQIRVLSQFGNGEGSHSGWGRASDAREDMCSPIMQRPLSPTQYGDATNGYWKQAQVGTVFADRPAAFKHAPDPLTPIEEFNAWQGAGKKGKCDIAANRSQMFHIDIYVPKTVPIGTYTGSVVVRIAGATVFTIPISLVVKSFTLSDVPSIKAWTYTQLADVTESFEGIRGISGWAGVDAPMQARMNALLDQEHRLLRRHGWHLNTAGQSYSQENDGTGAEAVLELPKTNGTYFTNANGYAGRGENTDWLFAGPAGTVYGGGTGAFWRGGIDGYSSQVANITGMTRAAVCVITTDAPHGMTTGDCAWHSGMPADWLSLEADVYYVTVLSATTYSIPVNTTGFSSAYTSGGKLRGAYDVASCRTWINNLAAWKAANIPSSEFYVYLKDEVPLDRFPLLKCIIRACRDHGGAGAALKLMTTTFPTHAVFGEIAGTIGSGSMSYSPGAMNLRELDVVCTYGIGARGDQDGRAAREVEAINWLNANGKKVTVYNGLGGNFGRPHTDATGVNRRVTGWAMAKKGIDDFFQYRVDQFSDFQNSPYYQPGARFDPWNTAMTFGHRPEAPSGAVDNGGQNIQETQGPAFVSVGGSNASNGDGLFVYPGKDVLHPGTTKAPGLYCMLPSLRLKQYRRGFQDADLYNAAIAAGGAAATAATTGAAAVIPQAFQERVHARGPDSFSEDWIVYETNRRNILNALG